MKLCLSKEKDHTDPPVISREVKKRIYLLQQFFMQEGNENSPSAV